MFNRLKEIFALKERYEVLSGMVEYLLISQLNAQSSLETGVSSNTQLRRVFLNLVKLLQPTVFCDIGSRDGESAIRVSQALPGCKCYAFEANPEVYSKYKNDVRLNQIQYLNLALGDRTGSAKIFTPTTLSKALIGEEVVEVETTESLDNGKTSLLERNETASYVEFSVPSYRLDDYIKVENLRDEEHLFALWIDVEGAGSKVLAGAQNTLKNTAIVFIEVENYDFWKGQEKCHQICQSLIRQGFIPIARDREYGDHQFNMMLVNSKCIKSLYRNLFRLNKGINRTKSLRDLQAVKNQAKLIASLEVPAKKKPSFSSLESCFQSEIPIYIPCFNNVTYLKGMVEQLMNLGCRNIVVIDNHSTFPPHLQYLQQIESDVTVIYLNENKGPHYPFNSESAYALLPTYFCITDPDLELNSNLPPDFLIKLMQLTEEFQVGKAGFSLDISDPDRMVQTDFKIGKNYYKIWEWEQRFWQEPLQSKQSYVYKADIDTTFALYNKKYFDRHNPLSAVRVAGNFTCKHLPWYQENRLPAEEEAYYRKSNRFSYYLSEQTT